MKKIIAIVMALAMVCTLAFVFTSCTDNASTGEESSSTEAEATGSMTATEGVLVMATNAAFPPYESVENGKIVGIDADIMQAICDKLGLYAFAYNDDYFGNEAPPRQRLPYGAHDFYLEAIVAAVYLDRGLEYTRQWVLKFWKTHSKTARLLTD